MTSATASSISVAWDPSTDNVRVRGYYVYVDGNRSTVSTTAYTIWQLSCGESVAVGVEAFDKAGNRSPRATATVSSAPCPDRSPPTAPSRFRQVATSDTAVVLAWTASTDDTGVVGYGVYRSGLPMTTSPEPSVTLARLSCGSTYEYAVDAVDAAGNRSSRSPVWVVTNPCASPPPPGDTEPPSKPVGIAWHEYVDVARPPVAARRGQRRRSPLRRLPRDVRGGVGRAEGRRDDRAVVHVRRSRVRH